ncbi:MAG: C40 family peptidase [Holdemanella sp.]|nr:C40 family peptidase [Holdemanella sp.]
MNYLETNGKKVAAAVAVASTIPVISTVYAMESQPELVKDNVVNSDAKIIKCWQEIEGKSYFLKEEETNVSQKQSAAVASVSTDIMGDVVEQVSTSTTSIVNEQEELKETIEKDLVVQDVISVQETIVQPTFATENIDAQEVIVQPTVTIAEEPSSNTNVTVSAPVAVDAPEIQLTPAEEPNVAPTNAPVAVDAPYIDPYVQFPGENNATGTQTNNQYADLNQRIANAAIELVGVTDGLYCTQVVQQALANAGVQDAYQLWPDQYCPTYGYYTDNPQPGNLIYYYNGGRGVDHIAIYIGDGMAVHGNYGGEPGEMGDTVIASVIVNGGPPQYIQVCR